MLEKEVQDVDPKELRKIEEAAEKALARAAKAPPTKVKETKEVKKKTLKNGQADLPITAIRSALKKAADKLGEDNIPEYDVKKPARASSVPAAPPVSAKQIEDYLDKTASMTIPTATKTLRATSRSISKAPRSTSRSAKMPKLALHEDPHHHHLQMIGVA